MLILKENNKLILIENKKNKIFLTKKIQKRTIVIELNFYKENIFIDFYAQNKIKLNKNVGSFHKGTEPLNNIDEFAKELCKFIIEAHVKYQNLAKKYDVSPYYDGILYYTPNRDEKRERVYNRFLKKYMKFFNYNVDINKRNDVTDIRIWK